MKGNYRSLQRQKVRSCLQDIETWMGRVHCQQKPCFMPLPKLQIWQCLLLWQKRLKFKSSTWSVSQKVQWHLGQEQDQAWWRQRSTKIRQERKEPKLSTLLDLHIQKLQNMPLRTNCQIMVLQATCTRKPIPTIIFLYCVSLPRKLNWE